MTKKCSCGNTCTNKLSFTVPGITKSVNQSYRIGKRGQFYKTTDVKDYQKRIYSIAFSEAHKQQWIRPKNCSVSVTCYNMRHDLDGPAKLTLDALQGVCYDNDSSVLELHMFRKKDSGEPRLEISLEAL
jgi:Holliday junction resolvase RusA-like endonuclease